jgi:tetratricopeptide (TPR) repeat protein
LDEDSLISRAITAYKSGNIEKAVELFLQVVKNNPNSENAWLWLSACVNNVEQKRYCLEKVLYINPNNEHARQALNKIAQSSTLPSLSEIIGEQYVNHRNDIANQSGTNVIDVVLILLLIGLGLFWLVIGLSQLGLSSVSYRISGDYLSLICVGFWNILISIINLFSIRDILRHLPSAVKNLTTLAIISSIFGVVQIILFGSWLQVIAVPIYIVVGVLINIDKERYKIPEQEPYDKDVPVFQRTTGTIPEHYRSPDTEIDLPTEWYQTYGFKLFSFIFLNPLWIIIVLTDKYEKGYIKAFTILWIICLSLFTVFCVSVWLMLSGII